MPLFLRFVYVQTWIMQSTPETEKMRLHKVKLAVSLYGRTSTLQIISKITWITCTELNYQETMSINNFFLIRRYFVVWVYWVLLHYTFSISFCSEADLFFFHFPHALYSISFAQITPNLPLVRNVWEHIAWFSHAAVSLSSSSAIFTDTANREVN